MAADREQAFRDLRAVTDQIDELVKERCRIEAEIHALRYGRLDIERGIWPGISNDIIDAKES